ncbi:hypothetical protein H0H87_000617 [Tephrocybe sp. NHM501043]|nr:hypothetical protein H0H87_000617 [Tephrocybe sp. NHM501043]
MDKDASSSNISVTKKSNLVSSAIQKEDAIFPPLNPNGLENLVTATNNPIDKNVLSLNMMVTEKSNLVPKSALFGPASLKNDTHEIHRKGATCPPLTLDRLENPVATANAPMDEDPSSPNMMVSETFKESPLFNPTPTAVKEMVSAQNSVTNEVVTTIVKMDKKQEREDNRKQSNKILPPKCICITQDQQIAEQELMVSCAKTKQDEAILTIQ